METLISNASTTHGSTAPTLDTLRALHRAHLLAVPFENLDIARGRKIVFDEDALIHKIVEKRRGGFCYELNGAFAALLRGLGFQVTLISARVARDAGGEGPEFDHLCLRVDLDEPWLADVGFGESFLEPLRLRPEVEQFDPVGIFRISHLGDRLQLEKRELDGDWKTAILVLPAVSQAERVCGHVPLSPDVSGIAVHRERICTRATQDGRITLADMKLIVTVNGRKTETILLQSKREQQALRQHFGITGT